jgi:hypothetical protein
MEANPANRLQSRNFGKFPQRAHGQASSLKSLLFQELRFYVEKPLVREADIHVKCAIINDISI